MLVRFVIGIPQIPFNKAPQPVAVEGARADPAAVHRTQDLEFPNWIEAEALWDAVSASSTIEPELFLGRPLARNRIAIADGRGQPRHQPEVDAMGVDDDAARGRLPKDLGEPHHPYRVRPDDVRQRLPRD